jgi:ribosomal protein S18 acetylase RimI-like enzyme
MTQDEAERLLGFKVGEGWSFADVSRGAGFVMVRGSEIHAWRHPEYAGRWMSRGEIRRVLQPLIDQFGAVTTTVRKTNTTGQRFVSRLGFEPVGECDLNILFEMTRLKHAPH